MMIIEINCHYYPCCWWILITRICIIIFSEKRLTRENWWHTVSALLMFVFCHVVVFALMRFGKRSTANVFVFSIRNNIGLGVQKDALDYYIRRSVQKVQCLCQKFQIYSRAESFMLWIWLLKSVSFQYLVEYLLVEWLASGTQMWKLWRENQQHSPVVSLGVCSV